MPPTPVMAIWSVTKWLNVRPSVSEFDDDRPLPGALKELVFEATAILALRELHQGGVMANLSLSSKRTVRLTPALDMPHDVFTTMFDRVEAFAQTHPGARHLLTSTPPQVTARLAAFAASKPKKRTPSDG